MLVLNDMGFNRRAGPVGLAASTYEWNAQWYRRGLITPWVWEAALRDLRRCRRAAPDCDLSLRSRERRGV
ncbi:MAG TPA: hypothetical protein VG321_09805 [Solirubrobacteraceae bacterium]|nr:hypothetical protein [Solirubrobacteraceae bacterium]